MEAKATRSYGGCRFLLCLLSTLLATVVLSRYRQSLALLWIPWAAYFSVSLWKWVEKRQIVRVAVAVLFLAAGWWLCLEPLALRPRQTYFRSTEYRLAAVIFEKHGRPDKARESLELLKKRRASE